MVPKGNDRPLAIDDGERNLVGNTHTIVRFESRQPVLKFTVAFQKSLVFVASQDDGLGTK